ncbi:MAG: hypothetical protein NZ576_04415 [Bacteroidia bacterium]|nr:hypothetical protein [Bacteroidia bacterium]
MKKVLIANIGNRNILYDRQPIKAENKGQDYTGDTFYSITKLLYEAGQMEKIEPNILPTLLGQVYTEVESVLLIGSHQEPPQSQDTYYVALLLEKIFSKQYPEIKFSAIPIPVVIDVNQLIIFYRNLLKPMQESKQPVIICDAGGTAQQKMAMKIAAEYVLKHRQFEVYNVKQEKNLQSTVEKVEPFEFRKILDLETALSLVKHGNFEGALTILQQIQFAEPIIHYIEFLKHRFTLRYEQAKKIGEDNKEAIKQYFEKLDKFLKREPAETYTEFRAALDSNQFFNLREILLVAHYFYHKKNYNDCLLQFHVFVENYTQFLLKKFHNIDTERPSQREGVRKKIKNSLKSRAQSYLQQYVLLCAETKELNETNKTIVDQLFKLLIGKNPSDNSFSELRNHAVHKGIVLSKEEIFRKLPEFDQCFSKVSEKFGLPDPNHNFYINAEKVIEKALR